MQDTASQFVQLTWLFTTQPELLRAASVELPLALPRNVDRWVYEVVGRGGAGHAGRRDRRPSTCKPRREPRPGNDLVAEIWFAPTLQYLPVRIRIRQDAETCVDLLIDAAAAAGRRRGADSRRA